MKGVIQEDMLSVMIRLMTILSKTEIDFVAAIWWITWHVRNKLIFERKKPNPMVAAAKAKAIIDAY